MFIYCKNKLYYKDTSGIMHDAEIHSDTLVVTTKSKDKVVAERVYTYDDVIRLYNLAKITTKKNYDKTKSPKKEEAKEA